MPDDMMYRLFDSLLLMIKLLLTGTNHITYMTHHCFVQNSQLGSLVCKLLQDQIGSIRRRLGCMPDKFIK